MEDNERLKNSFKQIRHLTVVIIVFFMAMASILFYILVDPNLTSFKSDKDNPSEYAIIPEPDNSDFDKIEDGIHLRTGFVADDGLMLVVNNCTNCHSAKLVTQNRMSKERWLATIRWMQESQNLWDLGENEETIVNYLATNYAPMAKGRRQNLIDIEWYELED